MTTGPATPTPSRETPPAETPYVREPGYAERYRDRRFHSGSGPGTHARELAAVADLLRAAGAAAGPWLDVPAGAGRLSDACPQPVVQVDRDPAMLRACPPAAGRARVCASALRLPFADDAFAGVLCLRLLQHIAATDERTALLRELARVSRGPVLFSYFDAASLPHWRRQLRRALGKTRSGRCAVRWARLAAELRAAGLRPIARRPLRRFFSEQTLVLSVPCTTDP